MKKIIATIALTMVTFFASGQNVVHEYVQISLEEWYRRITVVPTSGEPKMINLKDVNGKQGELDLRTALTTVQEYEATGWELFSFDMHRQENETMARMIWLMRKPKQ